MPTDAESAKINIKGNVNFNKSKLITNANLDSTTTYIDNELAFQEPTSQSLLYNSSNNIVGIKNYFATDNSVYDKTIFTFDTNNNITGYSVTNESNTTVKTVVFGKETV
jgi:hypothetical protein